MRKYNVYRTDKGNLTFKENGDCIYVIRCTTDLGAEEALRMLKKADKNNKDIYDGSI